MSALRRFSKSFPALLAIAAVALLSVGEKAAAQTAPQDVYTVADVPVDATAASAMAARDAARAEGQRHAFAILYARLTLAADRARMPRLSDSRLTDMIRDFEVANERSSAVRYLANYTFRFRPEAVRQLLRNAGIRFSETVSKPVTVLAVLRHGDTAVLWEDPNPWRDAWANFKSSGGLVPLVVPVGEAGDVAAIGPDQAIAANADALSAVSALHGGGDVLIAQATLADDGHVETMVRRASGADVTQVSAATYRPNPGESPADLLARAVSGSDNDIEEAWKRQTLVGYGTENVLTADVPITGIADWLFVRDRLSGVSGVQRTDLLMLGRQSARVEIHYTGDPSRLQLALAQRDLALSGEGSSWTLQRRGSTPPPS